MKIYLFIIQYRETGKTERLVSLTLVADLGGLPSAISALVHSCVEPFPQRRAQPSEVMGKCDCRLGKILLSHLYLPTQYEGMSYYASPYQSASFRTIRFSNVAALEPCPFPSACKVAQHYMRLGFTSIVKVSTNYFVWRFQCRWDSTG